MRSYLLGAAGACLLVIGSFVEAATTVLTSPDQISNPTIEGFENIIGISVLGGVFQPGLGTPAAGFVFGSGLELIAPDPNGSDGMLVGDFGVGGAKYGCCGGVITNASQLHGGTAYAALGSGTTFPAHTYRLPDPVTGVGLFIVSDGPVSLSIFDTVGGLIGEHSFGAQDIPLLDTNFVGLASDTLIGSFSISSNNLFAYDDILFGAAVVPLPAGVWLFGSGLLGLAGVAGRRGRGVRSRPATA